MREVDSEKALKALHANITLRSARLIALRSYVEGKQYDGLPDWFDTDVPVTKRAPHVVEPIVEQAVDSFGDLLLGDTRVPSVAARNDEEDDDDPTELDLSEEEAAAVNRFLQKADAAGGVTGSLRTAIKDALSVGSAVAIVCLRDGVPTIEVVKAEHCEPTWEPGRPGLLRSLEIRYPYIREFWDDSARKWRAECLIFRRVIDAEADTTYLPAKAREDGSEPTSWRVDKGLTVDHHLGFCPAHWYGLGLRQISREEYDGDAIHKTLTDEIDALNRGLSQRNRAALYTGDPQLVELGVPKDHEPAPTGDMSTPIRAYVDASGRVVESPEVRMANAQWRVLGGGKPLGMGRKKGPGVVWRYPAIGADGNGLPKVEYLTLPDGSMQAIEDDIKDIRQLICTSMSYVPLDPGSLKGLSGSGISNISGRMLEWLYQRQLIRASELREDFGRACMVPVYWLLLRVCAAKAEGVYVSGVGKIAQIVSRFRREVDGAGERWFSPRILLKWPPYFQPTETDRETAAKQAREDHKAGFITLTTAVERIAPNYGIEDPVAYAKEVEAEAEAKHREAMELMHAASPGIADEDSGTDPGPADRGRAGDDGGGSRGSRGAPGASADGDGVEARPAREARGNSRRRRR